MYKTALIIILASSILFAGYVWISWIRFNDFQQEYAMCEWMLEYDRLGAYEGQFSEVITNCKNLIQ